MKIDHCWAHSDEGYRIVVKKSGLSQLRVTMISWSKNTLLICLDQIRYFKQGVIEKFLVRGLSKSQSNQSFMSNYCRTGFNCKNALIVNCEFLLSSQLLEMHHCKIILTIKVSRLTVITNWTTT